MICIQEQEYLSQQVLVLSLDEIIYQSTDGTLANASAMFPLIHTFTQNTHIDVYRVQGTFGSGNVIGNTSAGSMDCKHC